jgi:hypothetical protein
MGCMRGSRRVILGVVAVLAAASVAWQPGAAPAAMARHLRGRSSAADPTVTVGPALPVRAIAPNFLGFSFEYPALQQMAGTDPNSVDPVFEQLIDNLTGGDPTLIRIGGISTDRTWWPVAGATRSPAAYYTLTRRRLEVAVALAYATNARLIFGVNLEADSSIEAAAESRAILTAVGRPLLAGIELGNEPELYGSKWYYKRGGQEVFARPPGWDFQSYMSDYLHIAAALGHVPLVGPAIGSYAWMPYLSQYLNAEHVGLVTLHRYPLQSCGPSPGSPKYPSIANLLSLRASEALAEGLRPYVEIAHARGELVRNAEMNSVSCGYAHGSANTFASALWMLDTLFAMANVGLDGVNIHTYSTAADQMFLITRFHSRWLAYVAPEYYGVMMFAQAAPAGSHLLQVSGVQGISTVRAWATVTPSGQINVVLLNDATDHPQDLIVRVPARRGAPTMERLQAPSVQATAGVTIGGQTFGHWTASGLLKGPFRLVRFKSANSYLVRLPAASAAMLTFG